jgi:hypothetical protein
MQTELSRPFKGFYDLLTAFKSGRMKIKKYRWR